MEEGNGEVGSSCKAESLKSKSLFPDSFPKQKAL